MSIQKYLPSKQFGIFVGGVVLVGFLIFLIIRIINNKANTFQNVKEIATRQIVEEKDTDNDGVKDWEEALWGLNPNNPDSNGDGVLDGQEVAQRRQEIQDSGLIPAGDTEPQTETERLARQLLTIGLNVYYTDQGGVDQAKLAEIVDSFATGFVPEPINLYKVSDIKISTTQTAAGYYKAMNKAMGYLAKTSQNELAIFELAISANKEKLLKDLDPIVKAYGDAPEKTLGIEVPTQIAAAHVEYLNSLLQKAVAIHLLSQYFSDPVVSIKGLREYEYAEERLTKSGTILQNYLQSYGIIISL